MKSELLIHWAITVCLAITFGTLVFGLRQSPLYLIYHEPVLNAVFNGLETEHLIYTPSFTKNMTEQLNHIKPQLSATAWANCSNSFLNEHKTAALLRQFVDQSNPKDLTIKKQDDRVCVTLLLITSPPIAVQYYFTGKNADFCLDSIVGVDKLLLHYAQSSGFSKKKI